MIDRKLNAELAQCRFQSFNIVYTTRNSTYKSQGGFCSDITWFTVWPVAPTSPSKLKFWALAIILHAQLYPRSLALKWNGINRFVYGAPCAGAELPGACCFFFS